MAAEGAAGLLDADHRVRPGRVARLVRESTTLDRTENIWRLDRVDTAYRKLGGRYAKFADQLAEERNELLDQAARDMEDFAFLTEAWPSLMEAART
jgi:hypothetical protein